MTCCLLSMIADRNRFFFARRKDRYDDKYHRVWLICSVSSWPVSDRLVLFLPIHALSSEVEREREQQAAAASWQRAIAVRLLASNHSFILSGQVSCLFFIQALPWGVSGTGHASGHSAISAC
ncbi:hypothetical protein PAHAL_2G496000 [Panicum hallii]|uniref:Uncharacterized protein n=1 Tax=Panicum hallii TaxID=206008 RepID=A0A2S3H561_9POAL|nr:hypothetical protein PAHAL_2G496000 [Panicum hallii]